jgi:hypothetical protein
LCTNAKGAPKIHQAVHGHTMARRLPFTDREGTIEHQTFDAPGDRMRRILSSSAVALCAFIAVSTADAQRRTSLGIAAGATIPTGDIAKSQSVGYHILGTLGITGTASSPLGFRIDGMYNGLPGKNDLDDVRIWTVNGNLVYAFPGGMTATPYIIGGAGWYNAKSEGADESDSNFGINGGVGLRFALSGFSTFAEARFHNVFSDPGSIRIVPLTFGIMF